MTFLKGYQCFIPLLVNKLNIARETFEQDGKSESGYLVLQSYVVFLRLSLTNVGAPYSVLKQQFPLLNNTRDM